MVIKHTPGACCFCFWGAIKLRPRGLGRIDTKQTLLDRWKDRRSWSLTGICFSWHFAHCSESPTAVLSSTRQLEAVVCSFALFSEGKDEKERKKEKVGWMGRGRSREEKVRAI